MNNKSLGAKGENIAVWYLRLHLYKIVERNYSAPTGEIDIVAKKGNIYVFVEVKYRSNLGKGLPREAVDLYKQRKIRRTAQHYFVMHGINENHTDIRFDVVEIIGKNVTHLKNAF
jgi:putative endonuclease